MRKLLASLVLVWGALAYAPPALAQLSNAVVVAACGTPPITYTAGATRQVTQDTAGNICTDASATGSFTDDATGTTGNPVPGSASYTGLNVAGNLRGWTGVNPSGSIFAGQIDLTSVAGATVKTGNGTAAGSQRVAIASDNTLFHIIIDTTSTTAVTQATAANLNATVESTGHTTTQTGSTVTTHGTFQAALASSASRKGCMVQNTSADVEYVFFGATGSATTSNSFQLAAGQSISCNAGTTVLTDNVAISSKVTDGATYAVASQ